MNKTVVADASPLIAFARIELIPLLTDVLGSIIVPAKVAEEYLQESKQGAVELKKAINKKILEVYPHAETEEYEKLSNILDPGEAAAISLAVKLKTGLLIDERLGRAAAQKLDLKIIGTAGVILLAKKKKLIKKVTPYLEQLKNAGFYFSKELTKEVLKLAKENS